VHPSVRGVATRPLRALCALAAGRNLFDTGLAASLLVLGGVLERHPRLRIVLYHGGGAFAALLARLEKGYELLAETRAKSPKPPSAYLDHFWLDTVTFDAGWLGYLIGRFGAERDRARQRLPVAARPARSGRRGPRTRTLTRGRARGARWQRLRAARIAARSGEAA
jgi:hypothetical protein